MQAHTLGAGLAKQRLVHSPSGANCTLMLPVCSFASSAASWLAPCSSAEHACPGVIANYGGLTVTQSATVEDRRGRILNAEDF